jgi:hypothetical protein
LDAGQFTADVILRKGYTIRNRSLDSTLFTKTSDGIQKYANTHMGDERKDGREWLQRKKGHKSGNERREDGDDVVLYRNDSMNIAIERDEGAYCVNGTKWRWR